MEKRGYIDTVLRSSVPFCLKNSIRQSLHLGNKVYTCSAVGKNGEALHFVFCSLTEKEFYNNYENLIKNEYPLIKSISDLKPVTKDDYEDK